MRYSRLGSCAVLGAFATACLATGCSRAGAHAPQLVGATHAPSVNLTFAPEAETYAEIAKQYQEDWQREREKIIAAMEEVSGLKFGPREIRVIVYEGVSQSGFRDTPMKLNVRYPMRMTLIHELGHRLNAQIEDRPKDMDGHKILYLYLYDVWSKLYGKAFADTAVQTEKSWAAQGFHNISSAWEWALSLSEQERASRLRELIRKR